MFNDDMTGGAPGATETVTPAAGDWLAGLSEDNRSHITTKGYDSPDALAGAYRALESKIGEKGVILPKDDASAQEWDAVHAQLGRPETPEGYQFTIPEGKEAGDADKAFHGEMAQIFHKAGVSTRTAGALTEGWNAYVDKMATVYQAQLEKSVADAKTSLRSEWGNEFDANTAIANNGAAAAFGDKLEDAKSLKLADGTYLLDHPLMSRAFLTVGSKIAEDGTNPPGDPAIVGAMGADAANAKRAELSSDPSFRDRYFNTAHADHKAAVEEMTKLNAIIAKGKAK